MAKIILDTNIYFSAVGFNNIMLELLNSLLSDEDCKLYVSDEIWQELEQKIFSQKFDKINRNQLSSGEKQQFLSLLKVNLIFQKSQFELDVCRDPDDNKFLELAKTISAEFIISGDLDLLALKTFEQTRILSPSEFLQI